MSDSLVGQDQQLPLLSSAQMPAALFSKLEKKGEFTGERLWKLHPELYRQVLSLSAEGIGQIKIGETLGISPNTVRAVQKREKPAIDILKKAAAETALTGTAMCFEEIVSRLSDPAERKKISVRDLAIVGAVLSDKAGQLTGDIAGRVDLTVQLDAGPQAFEAFMRTLGATGLGGNAAGQKELVNVTPPAVPSKPPTTSPAPGPEPITIDLPSVPDLQSGGNKPK